MKNKNIKFIVIAVAIAIVFAVGLTYAYFSADVSNTVNVNATAETKVRDIFIASGDVTLETEVTNAFMQDDDGEDNYIDSIEKSGTITVSLTAGSDTATCNYDLAISNSGSVAYTKSPTAGDLFEYTVQGTDGTQSFAEINVDSAMASTKSATTAQDSTKQVSSGILGNYTITDDYDDGTQSATTQTWTIKTKFYNLNKLQDAQAGMNYSYNIKVVNVSCTNEVPPEDELSKTTNYSGYYADVDGDGTPDGLIFVDLMKGANEDKTLVEGMWNNHSGSTYQYNTITKSKAYKITSENYTGDTHFGEKPVISIKDNSTGNDRFYVIALSDYSGSTYDWNYGYETNRYKMDATYLEYNIIPDMQDSTGQSIGKRNTNILMQVSDLTSDSSNFWKKIIIPHSKGWFVLSRSEMSALGDFLYTKIGVTSSNYSSTFGLKARYWTSSQESYDWVWIGYTDCSCGSKRPNTLNYIRLAYVF